MSEPHIVKRAAGGFSAFEGGVSKPDGAPVKPKAKGRVCINDGDFSRCHTPFALTMQVLRAGGFPVEETHYERTNTRMPQAIFQQVIFNARQKVGASIFKTERDEKGRRTYLIWE